MTQPSGGEKNIYIGITFPPFSYLEHVYFFPNIKQEIFIRVNIPSRFLLSSFIIMPCYNSMLYETIAMEEYFPVGDTPLQNPIVCTVDAFFICNPSLLAVSLHFVDVNYLLTYRNIGVTTFVRLYYTLVIINRILGGIF